MNTGRRQYLTDQPYICTILTVMKGAKHKVFGVLYKRLAKPFFFAQDPERVHDRMIALGSKLGRSKVLRVVIRGCFNHRDTRLTQRVLGIKFQNPIGLAAGFDKNAELTQVLPSVGFGFEEIGSITGEQCDGNAKPRLWRHKEHSSLRVNYGLKNDGAEEISRRLRKLDFNMPIGVSIAKTNCEATVGTQAGVEDYAKAYREMKGIGSYVTVNISCPNAFGGQPFTDPDKLEKLLETIDGMRDERPIFIKLSPNLSKEELDDIVAVARKYRIEGFISSNLLKGHDLGDGGIAGKMTKEKSNEQLRYLYANHGDEFVLMGCGGVFDAEDAYEKIKAGATLIQMITGMIYEGPQVIGEINRGLVDLLERDGYSNIAEAIGADHR